MDRDPQIVRQWRLLRKLEANRRGWTLPELHAWLEAEELDCHPRTVRRDLKQLQAAGFQVEEEDGRWFLLDRGPTAARSLGVSAIEMVALLVAEESLAGSPMEATLRELHRRVRAMLSPGERAFADDLKKRVQATPDAQVALAPDAAQVVALTQAVNEQRKAKIAYWSPSSGDSDRVIEPYLLWQARGGLYVVAHDHLRGQNLTFALQRIRDVKLLEEHFEPDPTFDPAAHTRQGFGVFTGPVYRVQVEFDHDIAYLVTEREWHHTQRQEQTERGVLMTWHMAGLVEIAAWVAGFGGKARVHGPPELAERVLELHRSALREP